MEFDAEDLMTIGKSTKQIIDKLANIGISTRGYNSSSPRCTQQNTTFPDDDSWGLFAYRHNESENACFMLPKTKQGTKSAERVEKSIEHSNLEINNKTARKTTKSVTPTECNNEAAEQLETSELNVSGYCLKIINKSQINKLNVARGLSESLREIFLSSPKSIKNSSSLSIIDASVSGSLLQSRSLHSSSYSADTSANCVTDSSRDSYDYDSSSRYINGNVEASTALSTSESSVYLNNNDSWSIYSTSDNERSTRDSGTTDDTSFSETNQSEEDITGYNAQTNNNAFDSSLDVTDDTSTELMECPLKRDESSTAYREFHNDIAFLEQCSNKMSTPDKGSASSNPAIDNELHYGIQHIPDSIRSDRDKSEQSQSGSPNQPSYSSTLDSLYTSSSSQLTDGSGTDSSFSRLFTDGQFVHGLSPLCKTLPNKMSTSPNCSQRKIVLVRKSFRGSSSNKSFSGERLLPSRTSTSIRRSSPKVRRRIIFTVSGMRNDCAKFDIKNSASVTNATAINVAERTNTNIEAPAHQYNDLFDEKRDSKNVCKNKSTSPTCYFESETEEAVYYLVTKYLENENCPW